MKHLYSTLALCLAGCVAGKVTLQQDMAKVQPTNVKIDATDSKPLFKKAIPKYGFWAKGELETESEYRARLASIGVEGQEVTFVVDPKMIEVMAFPDQGFYIIHAKDWFPPYRTRVAGLDDKDDCITLTEEVRAGRTAPMSNAFGVTVDVTTIEGERYLLKISNFAALPTSMRWKKNEGDYFSYFGLPVRIPDPAFREKLKDKRITLAIRGRVGSLANARQTSDGHSPTISSPFSSFYDVRILPLTVTEAFVVDLDTNISVVGIKL